MTKSEEYFKELEEIQKGNPQGKPYVGKKMNYKTLEDVKDIVTRLKEEGYDETPENWYVDGEELLNELKILKL